MKKLKAGYFFMNKVKVGWILNKFEWIGVGFLKGFGVRLL
jgi:hypothetical protein